MTDTVNGTELATIFRMADAAINLKQLPRMGWLLAGVANAESVAEHSFGVAILAMALAEAVNAAPGEQGVDAPLSIERVLKIALLHDLAESIVTDLPKRATEVIGENEKHVAEQNAWQVLVQDDATAREWMACWQEYETASTPEARLVRDADKLEMIHQALYYRESGNRRVAEFLADKSWAYPVSSAFRKQMLVRAGLMDME